LRARGRGLRWRFVFLLIAGLLVVLLSLAGWPLVEQERALARQWTRERLLGNEIVVRADDEKGR
jgi:hypothetical protein